MTYLSHQQTAALLPYGPLADRIERILRTLSEIEFRSSQRTSLPVGEGVMLLMPASSRSLSILKTVRVHPGNAALGLPSIHGEVLALRPDTGERLAILDGPAVTERRTAAVSLLAARYLAPSLRGSLLIVGAGAQARAHLEAFSQAFELGTVYVTSRTLARSQELQAYASALGLNAQVVTDPSEVVREVSFVVTATTSEAPVLPVWDLQPCFVCAVGAFTPAMIEIPPEVTRQCAVYVDTLEGAQVEAGDLLQPGVDWDAVRSLSDVVLENETRPSGPVLFKSVGQALWDLAATELALEGWGATDR